MNTYNDLLPCEKVSYKHSLGKVNDKVIIDIDLISKNINITTITSSAYVLIVMQVDIVPFAFLHWII